MVTVFARYSVRPGSGDDVAATLARHVAATRDEAGCLQFIAFRSQSDPDQFLLYEQYEDEEAFQAHRETPHFRQYVEQAIVPLLDERSFDRYGEVVPATGS
jgi:quinol monooxygenase YgiN